MIFWQKHNKQKVNTGKIKWIGCRGVYSIQNGVDAKHCVIVPCGFDDSHPWFLMRIAFVSGHKLVVYDGSVYFRCCPLTDNKKYTLYDQDLGLSMSHKRCFDLILANTFKKGIRKEDIHG